MKLVLKIYLLKIQQQNNPVCKIPDMDVTSLMKFLKDADGKLMLKILGQVAAGLQL